VLPSHRIDIVVHGRFHLFAMAEAWLEQGHDVVVLTNYPAWIAGRFGVPSGHVKSLVTHGLATRFASRLPFARFAGLREWLDAFLHRWFGGWAARHVRADADIIIGMTGVMEEVLDTRPKGWKGVMALSRGSSHIRFQDDVLRAESERAGKPVERPTAWMIAREEREYAKSEVIAVLSSFALDSFIAKGEAADRLIVHPLGVDLRTFQASKEVLRARSERIMRGERLRVLTVGSFSYRKGALDLFEVASRLSDKMVFRFVGDMPAETFELQAKARSHIDMHPRVAESALAAYYDWADIFLFPTIEDGFAAVLMQAAAAGLPIVATANCSAPDIVSEGRNGWIVDIRNPDAIISRLMQCDAQRDGLAPMAGIAAQMAGERGWSSVAATLIDDMRARFPRLNDVGRGSV
jgi:glycosyltransferase involved in cell wall biosynthesis